MSEGQKHSIKTTINGLRALIGEFQEQNKSNSVLDFATWIENLKHKIIKDIDEIERIRKEARKCQEMMK